MNVKISPIQCVSQRLSAVLVSLVDGSKLLLCSLYMPCDDKCQSVNLSEYEKVLNELEVVMHSTNADRVFLGGDWNTDTSRN